MNSDSNQICELPKSFIVCGKSSRPAHSRPSTVVRQPLTVFLTRPALLAELKPAYANKPRLSFARVGEQHFLSRIQTTDDVYNIPVSHSLITEAAEKSRDKGSASGSSGSN